ncbi:MAG TPA: response regulator transcription factor [Spirochaetia bacterium]|nr:response regulator transcription factor [Spirochaetia bacterium]
MPRRNRLLLVEDELDIAGPLIDRLVWEGFRVDHCTDGEEAREAIMTTHYDVIVLDANLPVINGFEVCTRVRAQKITTPIIMLTVLAAVPDRVRGLKTGADDYLTKPFAVVELLARLEALLRRTNAKVSCASESCYEFGPFHLDLKERRLLKEDRTIPLTSMEFALLSHLVQHKGQTIDRQTLLDTVWGYDTILSTRTVDVHIAHLRRKLASGGSSFIRTVRRSGYYFAR